MDELKINAHGVAQSFTRAAASYDRFARVQKITAKRLAAMASAQPAATALDLGCGTGLMADALIRALGPVALTGVDIAGGMVEACRARWADCPDFRFFAGDATDWNDGRQYECVVSNCMYQWIRDLPAAMDNLSRLAAPGGRVAMAVLVDGSLAELGASYMQVCGRRMPGLGMRHASVYERAMMDAGFAIREADIETHCLSYSNPYEVMKSLQRIGAVYNDQAGYKPLTVPEMRRLARYYAGHFRVDEGGIDEGVAATYRILYIIGEKKA